MKHHTRIGTLLTPSLATGAIVVGPLPATADFTGLRIESAFIETGTPDCLATYRIYAEFDDPRNRLLAVGSEPGWPFRLSLQGGEIVNDPDSLVAGTIAEDFPAVPIGAAWDSFFTIGSNPFVGGDTLYSPGFAGSDGASAVLVGSSVVENGVGGWYDSNPGDSPEDGGSVLILQLTVDPDECLFFEIQGVAYWDIEISCFYDLFSCAGCHGDVDGNQIVGFDDLLMVLSTWGPCESTCCRPDLNGDGVIDFDDLQTVLGRWNENCNR